MIRKLFVCLSICCSFPIASFSQGSDWIEKGWQNLNAMRFDSAIHYLNRGLQASPSKPKAYKYRGKCYLRLKKFSQAVSDFNQSLRLGNDSTEIMWLRAEAYAEQNKADSAIADIHFILARSIDVQEKSILLALNAKILMYADRLDESRKVNEEALLLNPTNETALKTQLLLVSRTNEFTKIFELAKNFTTQFPDDPAGHYFLAMSYMRQQRIQKAIESLEKANQLYEADPTILSTLSFVYSLSTDNVKAMSYAELAIKADESFFEGYLARGYVLLSTFKYKESIYDLNHAMRLNPKDSRSYLFRGKSYYGLKNYKSAEADLKKCTQMDAKQEDAFVFLGYIYKEWNMKTKACESWKKALALGALDIQEEMNEYCK